MNDYKDRLYNLDNSSLFEYKCYYKTNMCKYKGECKHKDTCYFAHYSDEIKKPICINYFNHKSCLDSSCTRLHTSVTPFLSDFLVNILLDIIRDKRDRTRERIRDKECESERLRERKRERSRSPVNDDSKSLKRYKSIISNSTNLTEKEEELHKYYQNQVNEIQQSYQFEMNKISVQSFSQIVLLKKIIDTKDNELIILKTNIQTVLNHIYQNKAAFVKQQQQQISINQQPFSPSVQQQIKQEEVNKTIYAANLLNILKQYSTNDKPNAPSV